MGTARDNFVRLAEARTRRLIKDFELLGNLSNRSNYAYGEEDVKVIFRALAKKAQETELRFKISIQSGRDTEFTLSK